MNAEDFLFYLGKTDDTEDIKMLLAQLGVKKHPKVRRGDIDVYVELPKKGVTLVFELPEDGKTSLLSLTDVQLYAGLPMQDTDKFPGSLPEGLEFSDSCDEARRKLGPPPGGGGDGIDIWERPAYSLIAEYRRDLSSIALLHLSVPEAE
ncbi:hypothetical protein LRH25_28920 [Ideonella azotifigens]|uniref:Uncharacterized protein n=1 Tax=Ideonella azotifigens TaxID=513160 RepID=A0ABP3VBX9_9BURK|nr:hypothetical protein [Ideonella azotifigens]MCD2344351.1 hypothetical protein [Ideonella azotifigens]